MFVCSIFGFGSSFKSAENKLLCYCFQFPSNVFSLSVCLFFFRSIFICFQSTVGRIFYSSLSFVSVYLHFCANSAYLIFEARHSTGDVSEWRSVCVCIAFAFFIRNKLRAQFLLATKLQLSEFRSSATMNNDGCFCCCCSSEVMFNTFSFMKIYLLTSVRLSSATKYLFLSRKCRRLLVNHRNYYYCRRYRLHCV